jgi:hypothetical protein
MALTGVLDIYYQFSEAPIDIVCLELAAPVLALLMHLVPVAHHDEWRSEVQTMIGTAL